jgi:hypothetical protein
MMGSFAEDLEGESSKNGTHLICFVEEDSGQVTDLARSKCGIHELPLCSVNVALCDEDAISGVSSDRDTECIRLLVHAGPREDTCQGLQVGHKRSRFLRM